MAKQKKSKIKGLMDELTESLGGENKSLIELDTTGISIYDLYSGGGLPKGDFTEFVGNPGAGKTTIALQILGNQAAKDPDAIIMIFDAERSLTNDRLQSFGLNVGENTILVQRGITVERLFGRIDKLIAFKKDNKIQNAPVYILWDSIAHTPSEKELEVEDSNSAIGVKAKIMDHYLRTYHEYFVENNITMVAINQLRDKVAMGNMYAKTINLKGLGDRTVPGGRAQYFAAFHFCLFEKSGDLTGTEFGFKGYKLQGEFIKNKSALPFEKFFLIVDYHNGVQEFWTKFIYLKEAKYINIAGGWVTIKGYEADGKMLKFRGAQAKNKYESDSNFKELFDSHWNALSKTIQQVIQNSGHEVESPETAETAETTKPTK